MNDEPLEQIGDRDLWLVQYRNSADLHPSRQVALVSQIFERKRPAAIVFEVGATVRLVDLSVSTYWLSVVELPSSPIQAIAVASLSPTVRIAASAFGVALNIRRIPLHARVFTLRDEAVQWARGELGLTSP